jgi:UDP-N-acetylglucosamine 2-epimerase (non-hydrolysing)
LFPAHPRTLTRLHEWGLQAHGVRLIEPLGYLDFLGLMAQARAVLTDSGGIQEETTALGVACITIRDNTERPITLEEGTNQLAGTSRDGILQAVEKSSQRSHYHRPKLWDGKSAQRIVGVIKAWLAA